MGQIRLMYPLTSFSIQLSFFHLLEGGACLITIFIDAVLPVPCSGLVRPFTFRREPLRQPLTKLVAS